jgi:uncharacterized membrane protein
MTGAALPATQSAWQRVARKLPGQVAIVVFAVAGLGISVYLTLEHYAHVPLICSTTGLVDCSSVLTSSYSVVPGTSIPITLPGMLWCLVSGGIAVAMLSLAWRRIAVPMRLFTFQKIWGGLGLISIFYLVYAELVKLHHICAWCTGVHVLVLATFLVTLGSDPVAATKVIVPSRKAAKAAAATKLPTSGATAKSPPVAARSPVSTTTKTAASVKSPVAATKTPTKPVSANGSKSAASSAARKSGTRAKVRAATH